MRFIDFTMRQLVNKPVIWVIGGQGKGVTKTITKIKSCLSSGFTIDCDSEGRVFNYYNGHQKALTGRITHTSSFCTLVDESELENIRLKWKGDSEKMVVVESIKANIKNLSNLTIEQLQKIENIIKK